ncbi:MAG: homoserine kinase [Blastocatellia bacterium]|nr:homoserine kinase [Blastocatellia bacterium]MCS7157297.1 homoserine kinase [Blastocatellia bacterium]MCX7752027.1 homoserine kinase [Blastocatellia bacterium]MDW8167132.1 homoserine kinase [Acidobacteriota bacterium]MDW8257236.1 homoserine kinase [Acidobacteriota bacterium]
MIEIRVPGSTSNLGAGFDTLGLALRVYLKVRVEKLNASATAHQVTVEGVDASLIPSNEENLIVRAMHFAGEREGVAVPKVRLWIENHIPVARGLGGSGAAVVAGLTAFEAMTGRVLSEEKLLAYAYELEGHADNVTPSVVGSLVLTCHTEDGKVRYLQAEWPRELKIVAVVPNVPLATETARSILPERIPLQDVVFNLQRAALFWPALVHRRFELVREAMRDRVHQPYRQGLVPGLTEVLQLRDIDGLVGVALSGAGPTVIAIASSNFQKIAEELQACFERNGVSTEALILDVDTTGRTVSRSEIEEGM